MIEHNMEYMFILEDDACFDKQWYEKLNQVRYEIKDQPWHMITLNANGRNNTHYRWEKTSYQWLLAGYILSLEGAKTLLELYKKEFDMSDVMTIKLQDQGKSYVYFPWLIIQENAESTIGNNYSSEYQTVVRRLREISYPLENYDI
jgi:GR25 family glycosyltransferase involved in LPS biosynthesis